MTVYKSSAKTYGNVFVYTISGSYGYRLRMGVVGRLPAAA
jgi:hypothetical protein